MPELSVVMIVKNEASNIAACIESVKFADEIVVVDGGSEDNTVRIAEGLTPHVYAREFDRFDLQKNFAVSKATKEWVFVIDADERVTPELAKEIRLTIPKAKANVFRVRRQNYYLQKRLRYGAGKNDWTDRLFRKGTATFKQPIHEFLHHEGDSLDLKNPLLHYSTPTAANDQGKRDFYTTLEAQFLLDRGVAPGRFFPWHRVIGKFMMNYFALLGFLDGPVGFVYAWNASKYVHVKYKKFNALAVARRKEKDK
jgi:glycosyltransferase involved in cell wall biosynthesis